MKQPAQCTGHKKVTIVGAGMAGMTAALRLLDEGFHVTLLDQNHFMGGMMRAALDENPKNEKQDGVYHPHKYVCVHPSHGEHECEDKNCKHACHKHDPQFWHEHCSNQCHHDRRHEHSYHMLANWYVNFWDILEKRLGIDRHEIFNESPAFRFLRRDGTEAQMLNLGSPAFMLRNLTSGVAPLPDMFINLYSMIDLLGHRFHDSMLDDISVNGFMATRPYSTARAAELQQRMWETVWAIPSYDASAKSYKNFLKYGHYAPTPMIWLFKDDKYDALIKPWKEELEKFGERFEFKGGAYVDGLELEGCKEKRVKKLKYRSLKTSPSLDRSWEGESASVDKALLNQARDSMPEQKILDQLWGELADMPSLDEGLKALVHEEVLEIDGDLIIATTPGAMASMVDPALYQQNPKLGDVRKVCAAPMAAVELHFTKWVDAFGKKYDGHGDTSSSDNRKITILTDAAYETTFLNYSQIWRDGEDKPRLDHTLLYLTCSDCADLRGLPPEHRWTEAELKTQRKELKEQLKGELAALELLTAPTEGQARKKREVQKKLEKLEKREALEKKLEALDKSRAPTELQALEMLKPREELKGKLAALEKLKARKVKELAELKARKVLEKELAELKEPREPKSGDVKLDLDHPITAIDYLVSELRKTVWFNLEDVDLQKTRIDTNPGEDLFANETGSEHWRPDTKVQGVSNLFLAGTYVKNYADVATIEGAVTSGQMAAREVCLAAGLGERVQVKQADFYPEPIFNALKWAWAPYAYGAKAWSMAIDAYGIENYRAYAEPLFKPWMNGLYALAGKAEELYTLAANQKRN